MNRAARATGLLMLWCGAVAARAGEIHLRVNQLGYLPQDPKIAVAFSREPLPDRFAVLDAATGRTAFEGRATRLKGERWGRFAHHAELDFTALKQPGRFAVRIGGARSPAFNIQSNVLLNLPDQLLEFMRQQRCGENPWLGTNCHQLDGRTACGPRAPGTSLDARGGWHDAADLLKYLLTSGNATAQMLLAWQLSQAESAGGGAATSWADEFNHLGQTGANGSPDVLDEARWGLEWMVRLHPAPEVLGHQVADDRDHWGWRLPQDERADYGWGQGGPRVVYLADGRPQGLGKFQSESTGLANLAGRYAAAMALAFQIWKDQPAHADFARRCLKAGEEVYQLGRAKEGVQQGNSYGAPYRYEESTWADDMEWGAAELFRATGEARYLEDARRYASLAAADTWMPHEQTRHYQFYPFVNLGHFRLHALVDRRFQKQLAAWYRAGIERCVARSRRNPYRHGVPFIWCSNNLLTALVTQCLLYERMTGEPRYADFAARHRDWLLGRNPWGMTMFTGIGAVYPRQPHLMTTRLTGRSVRGGLVDGPVGERIFKSLKGVSIAEPDPLAAFQDERAVFHDDRHDYSTNEPTLDGTAAAILMWTLAGRP